MSEVTTTVISYIQLPCSVWKSLLFWCGLPCPWLLQYFHPFFYNDTYTLVEEVDIDMTHRAEYPKGFEHTFLFVQI